jgi:hypothetical protein
VNKFAFILFLFSFSFCAKKEHKYPRLIVLEVNNVVEVNTKEMLNNKPTLLGINFLSDTTIAKDFLSEKHKSITYLNPDTILPKYNLKIIIDTSYTFYSKGNVYQNLPYPKFNDSINDLYRNQMEREQIVCKPYIDGLNKLKSKYVSSFPVLIHNVSNTEIYINNAIGFGDFHFIQEAKDTDGKWKPIEFQNSLWGQQSNCGALNPNYILLPKHYLATSTIKYKGDFKTKIRIKMFSGIHYYYSNEVTGYVNLSQFDQGFVKDFLKERGYDDEYFKFSNEIMFLNFEEYIRNVVKENELRKQ